MNTISILSTNCTQCLHCVKVCPAEIFYFDKENKSIQLQNEKRCISCGHCVAVCKEGAVLHSLFSADKIHPIDYNLYPKPEQMLHLIRSRRSNRAFSKKLISEEALTEIVEAAYRAPTASNEQELSFTLITNPEKLKLVSDFTMNTFSGILKKIDNPLVKGLLKLANSSALRYIPIFKEMKKEYEKGNDGVLRKATALLLIHTPKKSRFGVEDANLAYQNSSLMAESLGVCQFYTGFVLSATKQNKGKLEELLGIDGVINAGMAMALPAFKMDYYIDKEPIKFRRI
ncbi:MAG: nitroreductase family protein [Phocaeicola sp.]